MDDERLLRERAQRIVASMPKVVFDPSLLPKTDRLSPWHEAAALLSTFQPSELRPASPTEVSREAMLGDCTLTSQRRWTLQPDVRARILRQLGTRAQMLRALEANPQRRHDALQDVIDTIVREGTLRIEAFDVAHLTAATQAAEWFAPIVDGLPPRQAILDRLDYLRLLEPFEHLVGDHFHGRKTQLDLLSDYVGAFSATSAREAGLRILEATVLSYERVPLMIVAAGGAGKSTLIAKFLLDHARAAAEQRFPFAYLDFDRPSILAEEPVSLLIEAVRQIGIEYPQSREACEALRRNWQGEMPAVPSPDDATQRPRRLRAIDELAQLLRSLGAKDKPFLLVLDTFEEVQYASSRSIHNLWDFLGVLRKQIPRARLVIAGRAPLSGVSFQQLDLPDLEESAARGFLEQRGIPPDVAESVVKQVGCNPLSLRLAAAVLKNDETEGVQALGLSGTRRRVEAAAIQGHLFKRILDHIHDDDVRRLAYPGLALRRITPELIADVLAQPCGVRLDSPERAAELFDELGREMSLVTPAADGALTHRSDVRRLMLPLLEASDPERMRVIEENAIRYYEPRDDVASRAEEIYHRLRLGQPRAEIDERWLNGVEPHLRSVVDEMTPGGRLTLAEHGVGPPPDPEMIRNASQDEWERSAKIDAEDALANGDGNRALKAIRTRKNRLPGSELWLLEARALLAKRDAKEAMEAAWRAVGEYSNCGNARSLFKSHLLLAESAMLGGAYDTAEEALRAARELAEEYGDKAGCLAVDILRVPLDDVRELDPGETLVRLRRELDECEDFVLAARPELVRDTVRVLGGTQPEVVVRALRIIGFATPPDRNWRQLLATTLLGVSERLHAARTTDAERRQRLDQLDERASAWPRFVMAAPPAELASWLADLLELAGAEAQLLALVLDGVARVETATGSSTDWMFETLAFTAASEPRGHRGRVPAAVRAALSTGVSGIERGELAQMLAVTVRRSLAAFASPGQSSQDTLAAIIEAASREGWLEAFLGAAARWWPSSEALLKAADAVGAGIVVASWSDRKLPARVLSGSRLQLTAIENAVCGIVLRRRLIAAGMLAGRDVVVTADSSVSDKLTAASLGFSSPIGTVSVSPSEIMTAGEVSIVRLSEPLGETSIDAAGKLPRNWISVESGSGPANQHLAVWRDEMGKTSIAAVDFPLSKKQLVPPGTPCFDEVSLSFSGIVAADRSHLIPAALVREVLAAAG
jgi:hypothetical protein